MGQRLFEPPSVKGWDGHRTWLNSATMLVRLNAATRAVKAGDEIGLDPSRLRERYDLESREDVIRFCRELTLDGDVPDALLARIEGKESDLDALMRSALRLLLTSPEYQMA